MRQESPLTLVGQQSDVDMFGTPLGIQADTEVPPDVDSIDAFVHAFKESTPVKVARTTWLQAMNDLDWEGDYVFTQEDVDTVNKLFPNDKASQEYIYAHANNKQQLGALIEMQLENKKIEEALSKEGGILNTVAGFGGSILGEFLNPLNYVGVGLVTKGSVLTKLAKSAALNAGVNVADAGLREKLTGNEQDLVTSAIVGAAAGAASKQFSMFLERAATKEIKELATEGLEVTEHTQKKADLKLAGIEAPTFTVDKMWNKLKQFHIKDYVPQNNTLKNLVDQGDAIVVPAKRLGKIARRLGLDNPPNTKAFHHNGKTVFVREAIEKLDDKGVNYLLLHEVGLHGLDVEAKKPLLAFVQKQLKNPQGLWRQALVKATASTPKGELVDPEEVLGYWVELRGDGKGGFLSELKNIFNSMVSKEMTEDDVLSVLQQNLHKRSSQNLDGSVKYSAEGDVSPNKLEQIATTPSPDAQPQFTNKIGKAISKGSETISILKTPVGITFNSRNQYVRALGQKLFTDGRMRTTHGNMTAEDTCQFVLRQLEVPYKAYKEAFRSYLWKQAGWNKSKYFQEEFAKEVQRKIILAHDHIYSGHSLSEDVDPEIKQLAKLLNDIEARQIELAKDFGYIDDPAWENLDKSTRRVVNFEKLRDFIVGFKGEDGTEKAYHEFEDYLYEAAWRKSDENAALLKRIIDADNQKKLDAYQKELEAWRKNPKGNEPQPPALRDLTEEEMEKFIRQEAHDAAFGYVDQNTSNLKYGTAQNEADTAMPWMRHRIHIDSSYQKVINGKNFSFDNDLRSYDLELILDATSRRWAGEIALHNALKGSSISFDTIIGASKQLQGTIENYLEVARKEGERLVKLGELTETEFKEEMKTLKDGIRVIRGLPPDGYEDGFFHYLSDITRQGTYARVAGNMGLNQVNELFNMMAYSGFKSLMSLFPYVGKKAVRAGIGAKEYDKAAQDALKLTGDDMRDLMFIDRRIFNSRRGKEILGGSILDTVSNVVGTSAELATLASGMRHLTYRMYRDGRIFATLDLNRFAKGQDSFGIFNERQPFSKTKLKSIGIANPDDFRQMLQPFVDDDGLNFDLMYDQNRTLWFKCSQLIDNQGRRSMSDETYTVGSKSITAFSTNPLVRALTQFKQFSLLCTNTQTFRKMGAMEREDLLAVTYELLGAMAIMEIRAKATAVSKHPDNESKQQIYLKKWDKFKDEHLPTYLFGVASRTSTLGSAPLSFTMDMTSALGFTPNFRTTTRQYKGSNSNVDKLFNTIKSTPSVDTLKMIEETVRSSYKDIDKGRMSEENLRNILELTVPSNNQYFIAWAMNNILNELDLPKK